MGVAIVVTAALFIGAAIGVLLMGMVTSGKFEDQHNHRDK